MTLSSTSVESALPQAVGPLSGAVIDVLAELPPQHLLARIEAPVCDADPYGLDLHLALCVCYELHYRGFAEVDPRWEWNPSLLHLRAHLEEVFRQAVLRDVGAIDAGVSAADEMDRLSIEPIDGVGLSYWLREDGTWQQMQEFFVHRSLYHLKEADPHAFAIPRLIGQSKASFVAVEFDEYGGGHGPRLHQQLFADLLDAAGLDSTYLGYLDHVGAETLVAVNLMSLFGLHRESRGAAIGHFASTEITSSPGSRRLVDALTRMGAPGACTAFYAEHVEADAVHEQVVRTEVVGDMVKREPHLNKDVVFGMRAHALVEDRLAKHMLGCWKAGKSSLRRRLS